MDFSSARGEWTFPLQMISLIFEHAGIYTMIDS